MGGNEEEVIHDREVGCPWWFYERRIIQNKIHKRNDSKLRRIGMDIRLLKCI